MGTDGIIIDDTPNPLHVLLEVDHLGACADVPDTDTPLAVTGGQLTLLVRKLVNVRRYIVTLKLETFF